MPNLPSGTVTFLFSDIEGSTSLLKRLGDSQYADLVSIHRRLVRETFAGYGGQEIDTQGDAFFYSFPRARDAVAAAVDVQRAHAQAKWPGDVRVRLRLGLHTGEPAVGEEGYTGLDVVRASRIAAIGHGGQVLLSDTTRAIVANDLPDGVRMRSLGERSLRDIEQPEPLTELLIGDLEASDEADAPAAPHAGKRGDRPRPPLPPGVPDWIGGAIGQWAPGGEKAHDLIEQRVLSAIETAFATRGRARSERAAARERRDGGGPSSASVADEIERLRALRESGALTDEQFRRAVDRVVNGGRQR